MSTNIFIGHVCYVGSYNTYVKVDEHLYRNQAIAIGDKNSGTEIRLKEEDIDSLITALQSLKEEYYPEDGL